MRTIVTFFVILIPRLAFAGTCGPFHDDSAVIKPLKCAHSARVYIVGEDHSSRSAKTTKNHVGSIVDHSKVQSFNEGIIFGTENFSPLEDELIYRFSTSYIPTLVLQGDRELPAGIVERIRTDLGRAIKFLKISDEIPVERSELLTFSRQVSSQLLEAIRRNPKYSFLDLKDEGGYIYGYGRSILFSAKIRNRYCEVAASGKNLWIQVGKGHAAEMACILKKSLPQTAEIQSISPEQLDKVYATWKTKSRTMTNEIRSYIQNVSPKADYRIDEESYSEPGKKGIVEDFRISVSIVGTNKVRSSAISKIVQRYGYILIKDEEIQDEFTSLTITFDPTRLEKIGFADPR